MDQASWNRLAGRLEPPRDEGKFEAWMKKVDAACWARVGLSIHDLSDQPFRDWYEDGVSPARAVARAVKYEGGE